MWRAPASRVTPAERNGPSLRTGLCRRDDEVSGLADQLISKSEDNLDSGELPNTEVALGRGSIEVTAAADAERTVRLREWRGQAQDHPEILTVPETRYLKCAVLECL